MHNYKKLCNFAEILHNNTMRKLFTIALFVLGMYNASVFGMEQEIILTELYSIMPLDDAKDDAVGERPDPNLIIATIDGNLLVINAERSAYVEVIDPRTGRVIAEGEVVGSLVIPINQKGAYTLQIYLGNSVFAGEFEIA